jgi:hypothetical protein
VRARACQQLLRTACKAQAEHIMPEPDWGGSGWLSSGHGPSCSGNVQQAGLLMSPPAEAALAGL